MTGHTESSRAAKQRRLNGPSSDIPGVDEATEAGIDVSSCSLKVKAAGELGLGVFLGKEVLPGQAILRLPFSLCVTIELVDEEPSFKTRMQAGWKVIDALPVTSAGSILDVLGPRLLPVRLRLLLYLIHARQDP